MTLQCSLEGLEPVGKYWSQTAKLFFESHVAYKQLRAKVVTRDNWRVGLQIYLPSGTSLSCKMEQDGYGRACVLSGSVGGILPQHSTTGYEQSPPPDKCVSLPMSSLSQSSNTGGTNKAFKFKGHARDQNQGSETQSHVQKSSPLSMKKGTPPCTHSGQKESKLPTARAIRPANVVADLPKYNWSSQDEWIRIKVYDAPSPHNLTIQILQDEPLDAMSRMFECLANEYHAGTGGYTPREGELVCALYDDEWSRAEVLNVIGNDSAELKFIDFGNREILNIDKILTLSPKLKEYPCLGIGACIADVSLADGKVWLPGSLIDVQIIRMKVIDASATKMHIIRLQDDSSGIDLLDDFFSNGVLVKGNVVCQEKPTIPSPAPVQEPAKVESMALSQNDEFHKMSDMLFAALVRHEPMKVMVTDARSPEQITIQKAEDAHVLMVCHSPCCPLLDMSVTV